MGQTLENGVYLPSEGERNCYAGLKTNWEILDQKVADVTALQQAVAGALHREIVESLPTTDIDPNTIYMILSGTSATENVYDEYMYVNNAWELIGTSATDLTNYYTKGDVDGLLLLKANASDLTSHTGDATIHVTTADKNKWNTVTSKANDSDVVHKSGNETKNGELTLSDTLKSSDIVPRANLNFNLGSPDYKYYNVYAYMYNSIGRYFGNEANSNQRTNITLYANRDTQTQSCAYITRFRQNRAQGALQPTDLQKIGFDVLENEVRTNNVFDIQCTDWLNDVPQRVNLVSSAQSYSFGYSTNKALINSLNPSSLGMPDLDNGIDISSYIDVSQTSQYTAPDNGYISICGYATSTNAILIKDHDYDFAMTARAITTSLGATTYLIIPVVKNHVYDITCSAVTTIKYAKFFPCLGNV